MTGLRRAAAALGILDAMIAIDKPPIAAAGEPDEDTPFGAWLVGTTDGVEVICCSTEPWRGLHAVRAGRDQVVDSTLWAGGGLLRADAMLVELERVLAEDARRREAAGG